MDESVDRALAASHEALRALDTVITRQQAMLRDADRSLDRVTDLLEDVDVDLVALERHGPAEGAGEAPARVLVVDDNAAILAVLPTLLTVEVGPAAEVRTADCGEAALEQLDWAPDLVVLDWQMPGIDGLETARRLRVSLPSTRIIMYSALPADEAAPLALEAGADRYVEKGTDTDALVAEVADVVRRRLPQASARTS